MADLQDTLLFARYYGEANEITERIALPRSNPFDEYDDKKFREHLDCQRSLTFEMFTEFLVIIFIKRIKSPIHAPSLFLSGRQVNAYHFI